MTAFLFFTITLLYVMIAYFLEKNKIIVKPPYWVIYGGFYSLVVVAYLLVSGAVVVPVKG
jgi:hypothetical protein